MCTIVYFSNVTMSRFPPFARKTLHSLRKCSIFELHMSIWRLPNVDFEGPIWGDGGSPILGGGRGRFLSTILLLTGTGLNCYTFLLVAMDGFSYSACWATKNQRKCLIFQVRMSILRSKMRFFRSHQPFKILWWVGE